MRKHSVRLLRSGKSVKPDFTRPAGLRVRSIKHAMAIITHLDTESLRAEIAAAAARMIAEDGADYGTRQAQGGETNSWRCQDTRRHLAR